MTKVMTPSSEVLTSGQITKICDLLTAGLRKAGLQSEPTQQVIKTQGGPLVDELIGVIRKRVEAKSKMIVRRVKPNRNVPPQQLLDLTGRKQYTDKSVVATMPCGEGEGDVDVYFFPISGYISYADLEKEYDLRGLVPDPYSQAQVNIDDPAFADTYPNGTQWKNAQGKNCLATFDLWDDERVVDVRRHDGGWDDCCWFAGVRK